MSVMKSASAELGPQSAEHHPEGGATGRCPVCNSESRSHQLVVTDEHGEWHIRSGQDH